VTEYSFSIKCIKSYTTGGTTYWEKDKDYYCKTKTFASFQINRDTQLVSGTFAFFELNASLFHEYFEISDTLTKLPHCFELMDAEAQNEICETRFFDFVKADVCRLCVAQGFTLPNEVVCEIAYNLLYEDMQGSEGVYYMDYLNEHIGSERLGVCG